MIVYGRIPSDIFTTMACMRDAQVQLKYFHLLGGVGYPGVKVAAACNILRISEVRYTEITGGRNSSVGSVLGSLPCVMQHRGLEPPLNLRLIFFPLELAWFLHSPKPLSDESINRGLVCAHMHPIARTQMILTFMS